MKKVIEFIRRFLSSIVLLLNIGAVLWLGLCVAAAYTDPSSVRYIALSSLSTPYVILLNIMFLLGWIIFSRKKFRALLSALALAASYKVISMIIGFNYFNSDDMTPMEGRLKVLNWNVHGVGIFDSNNPREQEQHIIDYLKGIDADVVCLPEFYTPKESIQTNLSKRIIENNNYLDYRFQADNTLGKTIFLGTAIFSKYPIYNFKAHRLSDFIYMIQGDIKPTGGDTIRMYFAHLNTFGLSDGDKAHIEDIAKSNDDIADDIDRSTTYIGKFNYAYIRRSRQVKKAKSIMAKSPHPILVCGDFNDLPASYTYTKFSKGLADAFVAEGHGLGRTYNRLAPTLRIDYIFYNKSALKCIGYESTYTSLSDHNPVIANFKILNTQQG